MRTLLLTGHGGFVGRTVRAVCAGQPLQDRWRLATLPDDFDVRAADLERCVAEIRPDAVLHLAARTSVAESFRDPAGYFDVNFNGTWNLLRALRASEFRGRMLYVSSGDCYGAVPVSKLPIAECQPLRPRSPYAVSKTCAESLCYQWSQSEAFEIVIARPFNHIGPGQDSRFATASFACQIARISAGLDEPRILSGDLDVTRDLTDVRDVAAAYFGLLESGRDGEVYNVGSGLETRMRDVLDGLVSIAGIEVQIIADERRVRPGEQRRAAADVRKIQEHTGWRALLPLEVTLRDVLNDWTQRIKHE